MQLTISHRNTWLQTLFKALKTHFLNLYAEAQKNKARRQRFRTTYTELCVLSNRELADLGIPRCHIRRLALEEMAKEPTNENL